MWHLIRIFLAVSGILYMSLRTYAQCRTCTEFGIACISETDFNVCVDRGFGLRIDDSVRYSCSEDAICTGLREVCVPKNSTVSTAVPLCTDECDVCGYARSFACTSRTTFALCAAYQLTSVVGTCPGSLICDTDGPSVCIEKCSGRNITCDRDFPKSTSNQTPLPMQTPFPTRAPTMTPSSESTIEPTLVTTPMPEPIPTAAPKLQTPWQVCAASNIAGRFPYDNDRSCINYVYCRYQGSVLVAVPNTCSTGSYFNPVTQLCETTKPSWCI